MMNIILVNALKINRWQIDLNVPTITNVHRGSAKMSTSRINTHYKYTYKLLSVYSITRLLKQCGYAIKCEQSMNGITLRSVRTVKIRGGDYGLWAIYSS